MIHLFVRLFNCSNSSGWIAFRRLAFGDSMRFDSTQYSNPTNSTPILTTVCHSCRVTVEWINSLNSLFSSLLLFARIVGNVTIEGGETAIAVLATQHLKLIQRFESASGVDLDNISFTPMEKVAVTAVAAAPSSHTGIKRERSAQGEGEDEGDEDKKQARKQYKTRM